MSNIKHRKAGTPLYKVYYAMRGKCHNPKDHGYHKYGAKGVRVCNEWLESFEKFHDWATKNGYKKGLSIDRINVMGNYEPSNCRWETREVQAQNIRPRSNTPYVHFNSHKQRYVVRYQISGVRKQVGVFKTEEEAVNAIISHVRENNLSEQRKVLNNAGFTC